MSSFLVLGTILSRKNCIIEFYIVFIGFPMEALMAKWIYSKFQLYQNIIKENHAVDNDIKM